MTLSLKQRLTRFLLKHHGYVASGELQRLASQKTTYSPQNVGRRLRELVEEGVLEVTYRKNHAYYRAKQTPEEWFNSI